MSSPRRSFLQLPLSGARGEEEEAGRALTGLQVTRARQISDPFAKNPEAVKLASMTHPHMTHQHHTHNCFCDKTTVEISLFVFSSGPNMKVL